MSDGIISGQLIAYAKACEPNERRPNGVNTGEHRRYPEWLGHPNSEIAVKSVRAILVLILAVLCFASPAFATLSYAPAPLGQLVVNPDGGASYSIPIKVLPGAGGLTPNLGITYSSSGGDSSIVSVKPTPHSGR
ncbi:MAG: hypothetical protein P4L57_09085 [Rhizomicrobium sp.]|nr:hypothetical protein [Rhizomicrobium sp.]